MVTTASNEYAAHNKTIAHPLEYIQDVENNPMFPSIPIN
jgi:hypothetical protein